MRANNFSEPTRACISIPLVSRSKIIGVLSAQSHKADVFTQDDRYLMKALANHTAIAIDNAVQHKETVQRLATLSRLYDTLASLRTALDVNEVLTHVVDNLYDLFSLDTCTIGLFDKRLENVSFVAERGLNGQKVQRKLEELPEGLRARAFSSSELIEVLNLGEHPDLRAKLVRPDLKSFVIIPLHGKALPGEIKPLGIITMGSMKELALSIEQQDLLRVLAGQAAVAVENAQLHEETKAWAQRLDQLNQAEHDIVAEKELTPLLRKIAGKAAEFIEAAGSGVFLLTEDKKHLKLTAAEGENRNHEGKLFSIDKGVIGKVLETKKAYLVSDYPHWPEKLDVFHDEQRTVVGVPIFSGTEITGVLTVNDVKEGRTFNVADIELLSRLGQLAGIEIEKALLMEKNAELLQERKVISDITTALVSVVKSDQLFRTIFHGLSNSFGYNTCAILLKDQVTKELYYEHAVNYPAGIVKSRRIKIDGSQKGVTAWVARNRTHKIVPNVKEEELYLPGAENSLSEIAVPLIYRNDVIGVLNVESTELNAFDERDLRLLTQVAAAIAIAIKNVWFYQQYKKKNLTLLRMSAVGKAMSESLDLDHVLNQIARYGKELLNAEVCAVFSVQRKGFYKLETYDGSLSSAFDPNIEMDIQAGETACLTNRTHSSLAIRLNLRNKESEETIGFIKVENKLERERYSNLPLPFDKQDSLTLKALASYAEAAVQNARLYSQANDKLTATKSAAIALAATSAWAHDTAHDTYILRAAASNLLQDLNEVTGLDPHVRETVEQIRLSAENVAALIPSTSPDLSNKEPVYVDKVLQAVLKKRETQLNKKLIESTVIFDEVPPVYANNQSLHVIFDNLIRNAMRYMPNGGQLLFYAHVNGNNLSIEVSDTGTGIPKAIQSQIFNRRVRGENGGTGIGLLLIRAYLLAYDGDIELRHSDSNGTIFVFHLPLASSELFTKKETLYV